MDPIAAWIEPIAPRIPTRLAPRAVLRALMGHVRPGEIVAFHEIEIEVGHWSEPRMPLLDTTFRWITDTFRRTGMAADIGRRLAAAFDELSIEARRLVREGILEDGSEPLAHTFMAETIRTLLPVAERFGVTTAKEVQVDTLAERLAAESAGACWVPVYFVAAWGRVPAR